MTRPRFLIAVAVLISTPAFAMPPQVSVNWAGNMAFRLGVMAGNPGFCDSKLSGVWICEGYE